MITTDELKLRTMEELRRCARIIRNDTWITSLKVYVRYDLRGKAAGIAYGTSLIILNGDMLIENPPEIEPTAAHELAHIVVNLMHPEAKPHGLEWKAWMRAFNHEPQRTHSMNIASSQIDRYHQINCHCQTHYISSRTLNKMRQGRIYKCYKCKRILLESL